VKRISDRQTGSLPAHVTRRDRPSDQRRNPVHVDIHQHLWPGVLIDELRRRTEPPRLDGWTLLTSGEPPFEVNPADHDVRRRAAQAARDGIGLAVIGPSNPLGIEYLAPEDAEPLLDAYHRGVAGLGRPFAGWATACLAAIDAPSLAKQLDRGFAGLQLPATALADESGYRWCGPLLDVLAERDLPLFIHPGPAGATAPEAGLGVAGRGVAGVGAAGVTTGRAGAAGAMVPGAAPSVTAGGAAGVMAGRAAGPGMAGVGAAGVTTGQAAGPGMAGVGAAGVTTGQAAARGVAGVGAAGAVAGRASAAGAVAPGAAGASAAGVMAPGPAGASAAGMTTTVAGAGGPAWWAALVPYVQQLHAAWFAFRAYGRPAYPRLRVCFAALAGLGPLHGERMAARGGTDPLARGVIDSRTFVETSSYGSRAVDSVLRVLGVDTLVFGSDRPYARPNPDLGLGEAARHAIRVTNPARLLQGDRPSPEPGI